MFALFLSPFPLLLSHLARLPLLPLCSVPVLPGDAFLTWFVATLEHEGAGHLLHCS